MRIMRDLNLAESTGHGVPNIVRVYGRGVFRITSSYINVTLPFDEEVLRSLNAANLDALPDKVPDKVPNKVPNKLTETQEKILTEMKNSPCITTKELSERLGISSRMIVKHIRTLKDGGVLRRVGSNKSGYWEIITE